MQGADLLLGCSEAAQGLIPSSALGSAAGKGNF